MLDNEKFEGFKQQLIDENERKYGADERFRENYRKLAPSCAEFLRDAINIYCGE